MKKDYKKYKTTKLKTFFRHPAFLAVLIVVLAGGSVLLHMTTETSELVKGISDTITMLAAIGFWFELKSSKEANEANFIMELNDQFISNEALTRIEHELMRSYAQWTNGDPSIDLDLNLRLESKDRKDLINYLVYLEGLASIVKCHAMQSDMIADLFAYRFFIAVNNPIVQWVELVPFENYYQGCYSLSKIWTDKWSNERPKREIPFVNTEEDTKYEEHTEGEETFRLKNDHTLFKAYSEYRGKKNLAYKNEELDKPVFPPKEAICVDC